MRCGARRESGTPPRGHGWPPRHCLQGAGLDGCPDGHSCDGPARRHRARRCWPCRSGAVRLVGRGAHRRDRRLRWWTCRSVHVPYPPGFCLGRGAARRYSGSRDEAAFFASAVRSGACRPHGSRRAGRRRRATPERRRPDRVWRDHGNRRDARGPAGRASAGVWRHSGRCGRHACAEPRGPVDGRPRDPSANQAAQAPPVPESRCRESGARPGAARYHASRIDQECDAHRGRPAGKSNRRAGGRCARVRPSSHERGGRTVRRAVSRRGDRDPDRRPCRARRADDTAAPAGRHVPRDRDLWR